MSAENSSAHPESAGEPTSPVSEAAAREIIAQIKVDSARTSVPVKRALADPAAFDVDPAGVWSRTSRHGAETLNVTSARQDLTGYQELASAVGGYRSGNAQCTQSFRFSQNAPAKQIPTLLMCWRISAGRSVYTVAANPDGRPSLARSLATIDREWATLT
ncbi:hypothetical protein Q0Z83_105170 [Actinoplanes sichuanensis]|uniref:Serine/threonine protein kinase n=1 Tax=Actinoplanes sichuanensis TaxID=512349 RepID=A0ABW4AJK2_9ACTN|nr:hypothetical protein [Actinoplanes sichuanensis]BEL12326.1 hypothetical protein Q0Z83_105170 [Actinoplanes sichuanensis]